MPEISFVVINAATVAFFMVIYYLVRIYSDRQRREMEEELVSLREKIESLRMQNDMLLERITKLQKELDDARAALQVLVDENRWYRQKLKMHGLDVYLGSEK